MRAKIVTFQSNSSPSNLSLVAFEIRQVLDSGGLVVFPTETVYGLAGSTALSGVLDKIYTVKGRDFSKPVAVLVDSFAQIETIGNIAHLSQKRIIETFLPGPLTVILDKKPTVLPDFNSSTVGIRWSCYPLIESIFKAKASTQPYFLTSANLSGQETPTTLEGLIEQLGKNVDLIVFNQCPQTQKCPASTVLTFDNSGKPLVLRHGSISQEAIEEALRTSN